MSSGDDLGVAMSDLGPRIASLRGLFPLSDMADADLVRIAALIDDLTVPRATVLMREGRLGQDCFVIVDGQAEVAIDDRIVATVGRGDFIGEMALLSGSPRRVTVTATTSMRLFTLPVNAFVTLLAESAAANALLETMATRLRTNDPHKPVIP